MPIERPIPTRRHQRAWLIGTYSDSRKKEAAGRSLDELRSLLETAGGVEAGSQLIRVVRPHPANHIGEGHLEKIKTALEADREAHPKDPVELLVFNPALTPSQFRNLEKEAGVLVMDRAGLILDIFSQRARTREGRLQVELAQLSYLLPRLRGRGTQMSRLGGGIGTRGPGETKLEVDQRRIRDRITRLKKDIKKVSAQRQRQREGRSGGTPTVALVGYTNSGKSTLLNRLTHSEVLAENKLFATLDPTIRSCRVPGGGSVMLSDTVGFIQDLPHHLIAAFKATFEETVQSDALLIVTDVSDPWREEKIKTVFGVLKDLKIADKPVIYVFNKTDLWSPGSGEMATLSSQFHPAVFISAVAGDGLEALLASMREVFLPERTVARFHLRHDQGDFVGLLDRQAEIIKEDATPDGLEITARLDAGLLSRLAAAGIHPYHGPRDGTDPL